MKTLALLAMGMLWALAVYGLLMNAGCDGDAKQTITNVVSIDGDSSGGANGGMAGGDGGGDSIRTDAGVHMDIGGGVGGAVGVDALPDVQEAGSDMAIMPDVREPDDLAFESSPEVSELPDATDTAPVLSTQIFPGLCCGNPGASCGAEPTITSVSLGACCPSAMTVSECQAMWGIMDWCYCGAGFECSYHPTASTPQQNWGCFRK